MSTQRAPSQLPLDFSPAPAAITFDHALDAVSQEQPATARALPPPIPEPVTIARAVTPLPHFRAHSPTSREAAIAFHRPAATLREQVLEWFQARPGGATDMEAAAAFPGRKEGTVRARRCELVEAGRLRDSGRVGMNGGRRVVIWEVVAEDAAGDPGKRSRQNE